MGRPRMRRGEPLWPIMPLAAVVARDGPLCPHCGQAANTRQHRRSRGAGGSNERERPSNIIGMCWGFNVLMEQEASAAALGIESGWKLREGDDPLVVPVWDIVSGTYWVLADDRTRRPVP